MRKNSGFSVIELIVVIAIVGILVAIAIPSFRSMMLNHRLTSASNELHGVVNLARMTAIKEHSRVVVAFTESNGSYICFIDNGEGGGTPNDNTQNGTERLVATGAMPKNISMADVAFAGTLKYIWFNERGLPNGGGHVYLSNSLKQMGIEVNAVGNIRVVTL